MSRGAELQSLVLEQLEWEPSVNAAGIGVTVDGGVVTLAGQVPAFADKLAAERAAKRVQGVRSVTNALEVVLPASDVRSDADIAAAAVHALAWNIHVPATRIAVSVKDGWLTLTGDVDWHFQREAAAGAMRQLPGVVGMVDLIRVRPRITPAEIESRIVRALDRSAELDARHIRVELDRGTVVLRGLVRSWAEREEAERTAWATSGVFDVENHIAVENLLAVGA